MLPYFPIQWLIKYVKEFNGFPLCYFLWSCWVWLLGCCSNEGGQSMCVYENNWNEIRIELVWDISDMNIHSFDLPSACTASVIEKLSSPSVRLCKIKNRNKILTKSFSSVCLTLIWALERSLGVLQRSLLISSSLTSLAGRVEKLESQPGSPSWLRNRDSSREAREGQPAARAPWDNNVVLTIQ